MRDAAMALVLLAALGAAGVAGTAGAAGTQTHTVRIEGMAFQPQRLAVKAGDTVVWENRDVVPHTATAPGKFDSRHIAPGQRWTWRAGRKGSFNYVCTLHPGMKGTVEVE